MKALLAVPAGVLLGVLAMIGVTLHRWVNALSPLTQQMGDLHADLRKFNEALQEQHDR